MLDPGFDFLRNFHDARFHGREIDAIIVSHNHPDHNSDLQHLDDLRYEIWIASVRAGAPEPPPYLLVFDADTAGHRSEEFSQLRPHRHLPITFDLGRCAPVDTIAPAALHSLPFSVTYFPAQHSSDVPNAMALCLELHAEDGSIFKIGYTGDTAYYPELKDRLAGCDALITHISQPDEKEFDDVTFRKKAHLGYRGLAQLLSELKPTFVLVGEFWAGLADLRIDLVKGLRNISGVEHIFPTSVGMTVHLPQLEIECSECHHKTAYPEIRMAPPATPFGALGYLCKHCIL